MRAQVALICAVAHRPDLLILYEPSSGLDTVVRNNILSAVGRTISEDGRTVIFSSHLLEELEHLSDYVTMIHQGRVTLDSSLGIMNRNHHYSSIRFSERQHALPKLNMIWLFDTDHYGMLGRDIWVVQMSYLMTQGLLPLLAVILALWSSNKIRHG